MLSEACCRTASCAQGSAREVEVVTSGCGQA